MLPERGSRPAGAASEKLRGDEDSGATVPPGTDLVVFPGRLFQVMPSLTAEEYDALKTDISERGILVPVLVDQHGRLLDGHHRHRIAAELGVECPTEVRQVADDDEARDLALTLNLARRHLSRQQVRGLIADEIVARPNDSDRAIARRFGCSPTTVGSVRRGPSNLDTDNITVEQVQASVAVVQGAREAGQLYQDMTRLGYVDDDLDETEADAIRCRWEFGHELLDARDDKGSLPANLLPAIYRATRKSRLEVAYRMRLAERYPTEELLEEGIERFRAWDAFVRCDLKRAYPVS